MGGDGIFQRDWVADDTDELAQNCGSGQCWRQARLPEAGLQVDFVDTDMRDQFSHHYSEASTTCSYDGAQGEKVCAEAPSSRATRVLIAVNSWHEFPMADFLWYYNTFVAAPVWRAG